MHKINLKHIFLIFAILFSVVFNTEAQNKYTTRSKKAIKHYENALNHYNSFNNEKCLNELQKAVSEDEKFIEAYLLMANVYEDLKQTNNAITSYEKVISINDDFYPGVFFSLAKLQLSIGLYDKADLNFRKYLKIKGEPPHKIQTAKRNLEITEFALNQINNPVPFDLVNMGPNINSENDEYLPAITADEQTIIITVRRPSDKNTINKQSGLEEDFYISNKINGEWTKSVPIGPPLNSNGNEGAQCISPDGQYIYFTACNRDDGMGSCDIYYSYKKGNTWSVPENLGEPINTGFWESQPSISSDGKTLYFTSNRKGGKGGMDIWKSVKNENNKWSEPVNLGDSINTPYNELSPFIHPDNQTLYFSSDGRIGMGGKDIYYSRKKNDGNWSLPVNIGYPINTYADEINLVVNAKGDLAYFSSDKPGGYGKYDLYTFELYPQARPNSVSYMKGVIYDDITKTKIEADFQLIDLETGKIVVTSKSNAVNGEFLVCLPLGKNYALNVSKSGYLFWSENFSFNNIHTEFKPLIKDIALKPIKIGESVVLKNIFFDTDKYTIKEESKIELNKLIELLNSNKKLKIEISGHTDNVGTQQYNITLSENRAKEVYNYLIDNGINKTRLSYKGYGFSKPIDDNNTEEGRSNNRRTEFKVIDL